MNGNKIPFCWWDILSGLPLVGIRHAIPTTSRYVALIRAACGENHAVHVRYDEFVTRRGVGDE